jgi:hypothetical protein
MMPPIRARTFLSQQTGEALGVSALASTVTLFGGETQ